MNISEPTTGRGALNGDLERQGDTLLVTFGGIAEGIGIPRFEFKQMAEALPAKLLYVRDPAQSWYHGLLPGVGSGIASLADRIRSLHADCGATRLVCVGNSMGGYAALVVGSLLNADKVISFAPQTFISRTLRTQHGDNRWSEQIRNAQQSPSALREAFDLAEYLAAPGYRDALVFADRENELDAAHARRLERTPSIQIVWSDGGHALVKKLRTDGSLARLLAEACATPNTEPVCR